MNAAVGFGLLLLVAQLIAVGECFVEKQNCSADHREGNMERTLRGHLFNESRYDKYIRPALMHNQSIVVTLGISLLHIQGTNEKQQILSGLYSLRFNWLDEFLTWDPEDYCGVKKLWVPSDNIWKPDIVIINGADEDYKEYATTNAIIESDGRILWMVLHPVTSQCIINVKYFPFDHQLCSLRFVSWTYSARAINLTYDSETPNAIYYQGENQEWSVLHIDVNRSETKPSCCPPDYFPTVTFTLHMRRRGLFYVIKLIFPAVIIYALSLIGLLLPIDVERVNMETTVLLTLGVFLLMVTETMPPTPESTPVISHIFLIINVMVALSVAESIFMCFLTQRPRYYPIPKWSKVFIKISFRPFYDHFYVAAKLHPKGDGDGNSSSSDHEAEDYFNSSDLNEWQLLAESVDRLFLISFISLSFGFTLMSIILLAPTLSSSFTLI